MLERKRRAKSLNIDSGDIGDVDVELGEGTSGQETGVTGSKTLEEEVNNWDENAEDWDDDEPQSATNNGGNAKTPPSSTEDAVADSKRRND
jgi:hypothetical protein